MVAVNINVSFALHILVKVFRYELGKVISILGHIIHTQTSNIVVHLLVTVNLIGDGSEQTGSISSHNFYVKSSDRLHALDERSFQLEERGKTI